MALPRLLHPTPILSLQIPLYQTNRKNTLFLYTENFSFSWSFSSSKSFLSHSHISTDAFCVKPRRPSSFKSQIYAATEDPIVESSSSSIDVSKDEELVKEFSKTRLIAQNVPWTSTPEDIRSLFEKYGNVVDVELPLHGKTRNRGLAFVEMGSPEEALVALSNLESYEYEGRVLKLNYAKPKKKKSALSEQPKPVPSFNLFVANLAYEARGKHLKEFFDSGSGSVVSAEVIFHDNPRRSSGYGFVSFRTKKHAEAALTDFQGKDFMGRPIRVARSKQFVKLQTKEGLPYDDESSQPGTNDDEQGDGAVEN